MSLPLSESCTRFGNFLIVDAALNYNKTVVYELFKLLSSQQDAGATWSFVWSLKTDNKGFSSSGSSMTHTLQELRERSIRSFLALQNYGRLDESRFLKGLSN